MTLQIVGVFCEDIREEKTGQFTLVGVMPDNVNTPPLPTDIPIGARVVLPKLGLYIRIHMSMDDDVGPMTIKLVLPDGAEIVAGKIDAELVAKSKNEATARGLPIAGIVNHATFHGFQIPGPGIIVAVVDHKDQRIPCAVLNFEVPAAS